MELVPESRFGALHTGLRLKNDIDRSVLITRPSPLTNRSYICRRLPPGEAIVLSLFNGRRRVADVIDLWAVITDTDRPNAAGQVQALLDFYTTGERQAEDIFRLSDEPIDDAVDYEPSDFIMDARTVNLTERRLRIPCNVYYLTTLYCPQDCVYCYAKVRKDREANLLPVERVEEIVHELASLGVESLQFSGGDALARPGIFRIIRSVYEAGMVADIPTKIGLGPRKARMLRDIGVETVQFSLDCVDPETMDYMVGVRDYHLRAFRALHHLREAGLRVRINTVVTPHNATLARDLIRFAGEMGNVFRLQFSAYGRSLFRHKDTLFATDADIAQVERMALELQEDYPHMDISVGGGALAPASDPEQRELEWTRRAFCTADRDSFVLLPDGRVTVCEELYDHPAFIIGDLRRQSVMEMWNSALAEGLLHPIQTDVPDGPCANCEYFSECNANRGRCWRDVLKSYGWNKPFYPDPRCPRAPHGNRLG
ncbi:radical SAM protein with 4Fe4S-binding SPASM domain [Breoghania corrubedonensis]|uniref:Radical SAM protein with 4Fe4S-binding SPASM domain n=1 Tax=Breoghania corrubedonensis TaxID=665038 RepID=A0A2T5V507_9HYPH|nr:radical SAM protein [Breoghania corrubedonensis]PTW58842.1 radical SAM protein with 4Fe4S-binding SPASM domain [Breoghania corrubedonensis]